MKTKHLLPQCETIKQLLNMWKQYQRQPLKTHSLQICIIIRLSIYKRYFTFITDTWQQILQLFSCFFFFYNFPHPCEKEVLCHYVITVSLCQLKHISEITGWFFSVCLHNTSHSRTQIIQNNIKLGNIKEVGEHDHLSSLFNNTEFNTWQLYWIWTVTGI